MTKVGVETSEEFIGSISGLWSAVRASAIQEMTCLWMDLDGLHLEKAPADSPPGCTHLWGWSDGAWARLRIEGDSVPAGAILRTISREGDEPVTVRAWQAQTWFRNEPQLASNGLEALERLVPAGAQVSCREVRARGTLRFAAPLVFVDVARIGA